MSEQQDQVFRLYQLGVERFFDSNRMLHSPPGGGAAVNNSNNKQKEWYKHGVRHREDGPAIENPEAKVWYVDGKLHRTDGPAVEEKQRRMWFIEGLAHRLDGPAVVRQGPNGWVEEYWILGVKYATKAEFDAYLAAQKTVKIDVGPLSKDKAEEYKKELTQAFEKPRRRRGKKEEKPAEPQPKRRRRRADKSS